MKKIINILAAAALLLGAASCQVIQEDAFSTDPVAPEFVSHGDIIITENTMDEDVNFTWTAYKNLPEGLPYTVKATYINNTQVLLTTDKVTYKTTKTAFKDLLYSTFPELPVNDSFVISFEVSVTNGANTYASSLLGINVYAFGDAVAPVITVLEPSIELDPADPVGELALITWEPARLILGETVKYDVLLSASDVDASVATKAENDALENRIVLATDVKDLAYSTTVDAFNEAIISAGGSENANVDVKLYVKAYCASMPDGIMATSDDIQVKTYVATFPEELYLPGSHQGWDPATAPTIKLSTAQKGYYEGFVDLSTADGSNVKFKFSPVPKWENDFGGEVEVDQSAGGFAHVKGTVGVPNDIEVPSGFYFIALNKKLNILEMIQVNSLSMIGTAVGGWDPQFEQDLFYNSQANTFVLPDADLMNGEFKFRFNHDWTYSLGGTIDAVSFLTQDNAVFEKDGTYKVIIDVSKAPFALKFMNLNFPAQLYVPGSHNDWTHAKTVLAGDGEGHYEGFTKLAGEWGFKLTDQVGWKDDGATVWGLDGDVEAITDEDTGNIIRGIKEDGGNIAEGTETTYCYIFVDLTEMTVRTVPVKTLGIIGGFDGWAADYVNFEYDASEDVWTASKVEIQKGIEWKIRSNGAWDNDSFQRANLGFGADESLENLVEHGGNIKLKESGIYDLTLSIATRPYKLELKKVGEADEPDLPETMYMVGEGIVDWSTFLPMHPFNSQPGMFWAIRYIEAGKGFKFSPDEGWMGKDFCQLDENEGFTVADGNCIVKENGIYCIGIDADGGRLIVEPAKVYGIGGAWGNDWTAGKDEFLFKVEGQTLVGTATSAGNVRTFVNSSILSSVNDWWHAEFIPKDGEIVYRETGGDPAEVPVKAGQKIKYDFNAGTAVVE